MELKNVIVNENFRRSAESFSDELHPDVLKVCRPAAAVVNGSAKSAAAKDNENQQQPPKTSYMETMMHLFKGNVGPGCFGMAFAVKNAGLVLGPILILILGFICVHAQHLLLQSSQKIAAKLKLSERPDYAETVELCFANSPFDVCRRSAVAMRRICNIFICITQLGFCCIYLIFVSTNLKQVLDFYGMPLDLHVLVALALIPIWLSALITNLKFLGEL